ncbi:hypothetical protein ABZT17_25160 [Streptomyces sp. NPDC005648]|uniref:hypothetical protein n=1 Tax=Streptomyces sp. NPDC005648 TaxID=3157044 RepID=UPI0033BC9838
MSAVNDERSIGGVPLLYGFTTLNAMEVAVWCKHCLAWHHHRLVGPPNVLSYYEAHCYARPNWHDRGYWIEPTSTRMAEVFKESKRARVWEARRLAAGKTHPSIRRKQAAPEPQPLPRPPEKPTKTPRKPRRKAYGPRWPTTYPQVPEEPEEA